MSFGRGAGLAGGGGVFPRPPRGDGFTVPEGGGSYLAPPDIGNTDFTDIDISLEGTTISGPTGPGTGIVEPFNTTMPESDPGSIDDLTDQLAEEEPLEVDWETGVISDSDGVPVKDYSDAYAKLEKAASMNIPTLDEYMQENNYDFNDPLAQDEEGNYTNPVMGDVEELIEEMRGGPSEGDIAAANEYAASMFGLTVEEYQGMLREMSLAIEGGIAGMEGMSEEERALRERADRRNLRIMEQRAGRQIENIQANTGSTTRSLAAADEAMRSINDAQIQQQVALADEEYRRQAAQYESKQAQWQEMVQTGQMARTEYLELLQDSKAQAFEGYALQIDAMYEQNKEYLERYQEELASVEAVLNNTYKAVLTEMGIDQAILDFTEQEYNMRIQPLLEQLAIATGQWEREAAEADREQETWLDILGIGVDIVDIFADSGPRPEPSDPRE